MVYWFLDSRREWSLWVPTWPWELGQSWGIDLEVIC